MRMRQSLAQLERAFVEETAEDRDRREQLRLKALRREQTRKRERTHKRGSMRFGLLIVVLLATAAAVTVAMFETLYYVMG